jgi:hypothetical protein
LPITSEVVGDLMKMAKILRIPMIKTLVNDYIESLPLAHALAILIKVKLFGSLYDKTMIAICEQFNTFRLEASSFSLSRLVSSLHWNSSTCVIKGNRTHFISLIRCCFLCIILCPTHMIAALKTSSSEEMFKLSLITVFLKVN